MKYIYLVFLLLVPISLVFAETGNSTTSGDCSSKITTQKQAMSNTINQNKAIALANVYGNFSSIIKTENFGFSDVRYDWKTDNQTCSVMLQDIKVVYRLYAYCCGNEVVFQEDPNLTTITKITFSPLTCGTYCPASPQPHFSFCRPENQTDFCHGSPLEQFKERVQKGVPSDLIDCSNNLPVLVQKLKDKSPACTSFPTALKLAERGWGIMIKYYLPRA